MESLSDIETELRTLSQSSKYCELQPTVSGKPISFYFAEIADRIKAAAPTTEKSSAVGNAVATREALVQCELFLGNVSRHGHPTLCHGDQSTACNGVDELRGVVVRALSEPPRNCDVGTAEEQAERFYKFCTEHFSAISNMCSPRCPCFDSDDQCHCLCKWEQMPYEAEEGGAQ
ncbi:MAG: hypothetical protein J6Z49_08070 [Kiritimatiellae bacterium]|nr:hypothetical protein [Kiritimatiellia bacterium]